ncbi:MAG: polyprenyl synthetase family protein [Pirellulales bacterium]|nr:polyprenyl synthetase family protein [Pirellulales bacterium]
MLPGHSSLSTPSPETGESPRRRKRRSTSHLKLVPETKSERVALRARCEDVAARLDKSRPLTKDEMEEVARRMLSDAGLAEGFLGWSMVTLATAFWREQVAAVPYDRRLFLLPHCLKHAEGCPADYDEFGLDCRKCGACTIADFRTRAEDLGYKVLVAEGSPIVLKIIVSGHVDAITGVACLNVLEKAIDKILLAGIPCMAIPLLSSDCRNTGVDDDWVMDMINNEHRPQQTQTRSYLPLMRAAANMFEPQELNNLAPRSRSEINLHERNGRGLANVDPIAATEALAYDFLSKGGKHSRPFITLAVHDALTGGNGTASGGEEHVAALPDAVKRAAMSIETFHKASLVHDDIEDDDEYRYGQETLHRKYGIPTAINVGDYLIGLGYRLISRDSAALTPAVAADLLDKLADAHLKLSEGQGAELLWRDSLQKKLSPLDALKIYALKTAPAFEAALFTGARLAGEMGDLSEKLTLFSRHLGVAFQILNDLKDWRGDNDNKLSAAGDILGGRPTVLWALALEGLNEEDQAELERLVANPTPDAVARVKVLYEKAGVFEQAESLVDKYQDRAEKVADEAEPDELRRLLYYLVDTVLDRSDVAAAAPAVFVPSLELQTAGEPPASSTEPPA